MRSRVALVLMMLMLAPRPGQAAEPGQTQWKLANFTWVKRVPAEAGAPPNAHPATLSPEALQAVLAPVRTTVEDQPTPLFAPDELKLLARALSEALTLAQPGEDLILLSTHKRGGGFMAQPLGLTARLFLREGALNLIVQEPRLPFMDRYAAEHILPDFTYGTRATASRARLQAPGAAAPRADWLALPLTAPSPAVPAPAAPAAVATPAPAPTPAALPAPPAAPRDPAFYATQRERLKALKQLRDEGLLTEAEYQAKRDAIVQTL